MKKILTFILTVVLATSLWSITVLAVSPSYDGEVSGIITSDELGQISGSVDGAFDLTITGDFTSDFFDQKATFDAEISGDIVGTITGGLYCNNGLDSLYGVIDLGAGYTGDPVRIVGCFLQSGTEGDFEGKIITGAEPAPVTSLTIQSEDTVTAGSSIQMTAVTEPDEDYEVLWSVYVDDADKGTIGQDGVLHALKSGSITVIANTLDPSLATATKTITAVDPVTEVEADIDPVYTVVIPATVDFGKLQKDTGVQSQAFCVETQDVLLEDGYQIQVGVNSDFQMKDKGGTGANTLDYSLYNGASAQITSGGTYAAFDASRAEDGEIRVDTAAISVAGEYKGNMIFNIAYAQK